MEQMLTQNKTQIGCRVTAKKLAGGFDLEQITLFFSKRKLCSILKANSSSASDGRFSVWTAEPVEIFEFTAGEKDPLEKLSSVLDKYHLKELLPADLPKGIFCGGWLGYFSYELGGYFERLPGKAVDDLHLPLIRLAFYDRAICFDHLENEWWTLALDIEGLALCAEDKIEKLCDAIKRCKSVPFEFRPCDIESLDASALKANMDKAYYMKAFEKIKRHIYDGDVYQINFSQRFECDFSAEPAELFIWQNRFNPSPFAAFIDAGNFALVSASPEMFINIEDGFITTRPIKGTRPRLTGGEDYCRINEKYFAALAASEKDQAELNMIIDLERNDLARICVPGTRKVLQPRTIEQHPTVFHAAATVGGRLRRWEKLSDLGEVLKAVFPGGSITGAPKIRAMEIIDELEPTKRGVYTGSIGRIGLDGTVCLNIAIRTVIIKSRAAYVQAGGAIVADSIAQAEWDETITKARALLAGINVVMRRV